ncbi:putative lipoprotein [Burkholderia mallei 2002721280]|nr:putative lipoprotein [Burkholderia mallei 2002721280]EDP87377.1 putative lipoprotein [Burkholderia mallei ATCC 10399]EEP84907.1 conserved hypothetical protein [Burkholderia mallei GB8 horse 4]
MAGGGGGACGRLPAGSRPRGAGRGRHATLAENRGARYWTRSAASTPQVP